MDAYGWVNVDDLLRGAGWTLGELQAIVSGNTRFTFSEDGMKVRAFHGQSLPVQYQSEAVPPTVLYHGTSETSYEKILADGYIRSMARAQVHLSISKERAYEIGKRHGSPVTLLIDCAAMQADRYRFYDSGDGVWLTGDIPVRYVKRITYRREETNYERE